MYTNDLILNNFLIEDDFIHFNFLQFVLDVIIFYNSEIKLSFFAKFILVNVFKKILTEVFMVITHIY